ncbi:M42 family metallopeptidase [Companilactobacillus allii]|uniref:Peptidase M28 n=1 Tax=Companilactobacillus allii TaxID=1847728 RepID=A0A1P8Q541_9LACO|nr:M42 family metallopeptidase [Companilactobacillus allii]APX72976.1 peptidase M28 [Companilactobacillus allii]USQ67770.1 M42 family metallopeptidase [Companilactobacillus allii]
MSNEAIDLELLRNLSEADGIGGREREVSRIVHSYAQPYVDNIYYDNLGSIILKQNGINKNGPKVMLSAHMDEVGFEVRQITEQGFLKLLPIGGWWGHVMPAQEMTVTTNDNKKYIGVIGSRAPHGLSDEVKNKVMKPMSMFLDMGVDNKFEIEQMGIEIGNMITPNIKVRQMNNPNYLLGKAWDDRFSLGAELEVMKRTSVMDHEATLYFTGSTQEEVGIRGARSAVHKIKPDLAIAMDVTTAQDTPLDDRNVDNLGKGVVLAVLDSLTIANKGLLYRMKRLATEQKLDIRYDFMTVGGTDACNIHKAMDGIPTMTVSMPTRYMHSPRLMVNLDDYKQTITLLTEFCKTLSEKDVSLFKETTREALVDKY